MPEVLSQTVELVGRELNATLGEARSALEAFVEQPENVALLERCMHELHQAQGVLRVLEIYGAALLAEEMEQVARYLIATMSERKSQAESLDALMRAMVQLPSYLERVLAGGRRRRPVVSIVASSASGGIASGISISVNRICSTIDPLSSMSCDFSGIAVSWSSHNM